MIRSLAGRRAVTLIEAVLFVAIALALIVGGLIFFQQAQTSSRTQQTVRLVTAVVAEVRALYRRSGNDADGFASLGEILYRSGAVPQASWDPNAEILGGHDDGVIETDDGVEITLTNNFWFTLNGEDGFTLILHHLPEEVCTRVSSFDYESGDGVLGSGIAFIDFYWHTGGGFPNRAVSRRFEAHSGYLGPVFQGVTPDRAASECYNSESAIATGSGSPALVIGFYYRD